ncbi:MAG: Mur ligase family protein, partial [Candidatus Latescibacterota bacterium]
PPGAHIHMIAICGTGMGTLAGMLRERGFRVTGSDWHVYPPMSTYLQELGVAIQEGFAAEHLGYPDLVVVGNAVSRGNPEVEATLDRRLPYLSLPEVLREVFLRGKRPIVVTGTHGKTTTTALAGHLLTRGGLDPSFLVAGVPRDYPRSYRLGGGEHFVIEGDEYDSAFFWKIAKFFFYLPEVLIINNIEFDHADIYADLDEIKRAFRQLINIVPRSGLVLANAEDPVVAELLPGSPAPVETFGLGEGACWRATQLEPTPQGMRFCLWRRGQETGSFLLPQHGQHNVRNALAAVGAAVHAGLPLERVDEGLRTFGGVKRRQEVLGVAGGITLIDDFAHHPTAVEQTLQGLQAAYPGARFWAVFEPASATNARAVFEERYVQAFAAADRVVVSRVPRPERARQDPPFSPERLVAALQERGREALCLPEPAQIVGRLADLARPGDVVVFMSNGAFGDVQRQLLAALQERYPSRPP